MSYRNVFEPPGAAGRRTGFHLTRTPKKDANGLEDLEDFFLSDDEFHTPTRPQPDKHDQKEIQAIPARPLDTHVPEERQLDRNVPQAFSSDGDDDSDDQVERKASPFSPKRQKRHTSLTKSIALHSKGRKRKLSFSEVVKRERKVPAEPKQDDTKNGLNRIKIDSKPVDPTPIDPKPIASRKRGRPPKSLTQSINPETPVRKSSRHRVKPVDWWRSEKVLYKTRKENGAYVMEVEDVLHRPMPATRKSKSPAYVAKKSPIRSESDSSSVEPSPAPTPKSSRRARRLKKSPAKSPKRTAPHEPEAEEPQDNIEGTEWMAKGGLRVPVFEGPGSETQSDRTVAWAPSDSRQVEVIRNEEEYFKIRTLFDEDAEFSGGGIIELPVNSRKAVKSNDDTYFIFYVIQGTLEVFLSHNVFTVTKGCSFEIPMGNFYQFENTGNVAAKLFFVQSKYVVITGN